MTLFSHKVNGHDRTADSEMARIVFVGDAVAGKACLVNRIALDKLGLTSPNASVSCFPIGATITTISSSNCGIRPGWRSTIH
jgi:GTPase SAR1 family protein